MEFHSYGYRAPRFQADFSFLLQTSEQESRLLNAQCTDISEDGLAADLREPLALASVVTLIFTLPATGTCLRVAARVTHRTGDQHGFAFLYSTPAEARGIRESIYSFVRTCTTARPIPF